MNNIMKIIILIMSFFSLIKCAPIIDEDKYFTTRFGKAEEVTNENDKALATYFQDLDQKKLKNYKCQSPQVTVINATDIFSDHPEASELTFHPRQTFVLRCSASCGHCPKPHKFCTVIEKEKYFVYFKAINEIYRTNEVLHYRVLLENHLKCGCRSASDIESHNYRHKIN